MWNTKIIDFIKLELQGNFGIFKETPFYRGDSNLRKANLSFVYTTDELASIDRINDVFEFIRHLSPTCPIKQRTIKLFGFQEAFLSLVRDNRRVVLLNSRQTGASVMASIIALHFAATTKDECFMYVCPSNEAAADFIDKVKALYLGLPFYLKPGILTWNAKSIEFDNGSKIIAKSGDSPAIVGHSVQFLYVDNAAHIREFNKLYQTLLPMVSANKKSRVVVSSPPNGYEKFYELYRNAEQGTNDFCSARWHWSEVPGRDEHWADRERNNIGDDRFDIEYDLNFVAAKRSKAVAITNDDVDEMLDTPSKEWLKAEIQKLKDGIKKLEKLADGR